MPDFKLAPGRVGKGIEPKAVTKGLVFSVQNSECVVLTEDGQFVRAQAAPSLCVGDEAKLYLAKGLWMAGPCGMSEAVSAAPSEGGLEPGSKTASKPTGRNFIKARSCYRSKYRWATIPGLAAVFALIWIIAWNFTALPVVAYVSVDINPSLELGIDKDMRVVTVTPLDQETAQLIQNLPLKRKPLPEAISSLVEYAVGSGLVTPGVPGGLDGVGLVEPSGAGDGVMSGGNGAPPRILAELLETDFHGPPIVITVSRAANQDKGEVTGEAIREALLRTLQAQKIQTRVLVEEVEASVRSEASKVGLSAGRYLVYQAAKSQGIELRPEDLKGKGLKQTIERIVRIRQTEGFGSSPSGHSDKANPQATGTAKPETGAKSRIREFEKRAKDNLTRPRSESNEPITNNRGRSSKKADRLEPASNAPRERPKEIDREINRKINREIDGEIDEEIGKSKEPPTDTEVQQSKEPHKQIQGGDGQVNKQVEKPQKPEGSRNSMTHVSNDNDNDEAEEAEEREPLDTSRR